MKRIITIILLAFAVLYLGTSLYSANDSKEITLFAFRALYNKSLKTDYFGDIDEKNSTITVFLPEGMSFDSLVPSYSTTGKWLTVQSKAQFSDISKQDFTTPVIYIAHAGNLSIKRYKVIAKSAPEHKINYLQQYIKLKRLVTLREPRLTNKLNDLQKAIILRDHVYQTTPNLKAPTEANVNDFLIYYFYGSVHPYYGQLCQGMSITYQALLEAFDIPSRSIYMFSDKEKFSSHASVEIYIGNRWIASDPSFNVMPETGGRYLSYIEVRDALLKGKKVNWVSNGMITNPNNNRNIENYYISMDKLLKYLVVSPSRLKTEGGSKTFTASYLPKEWDRTLIINEKEKKIQDMYFYPGHPQMRVSMGEHRLAD